ncbi:MAG: aminopeptidase P family protein [Oscillospiraceae bacterium]|jgi:Xaa-Pro aminopeptidase|nr:aminopeptidase P family protein [Oscillospiraceae bacterium]
MRFIKEQLPPQTAALVTSEVSRRYVTGFQSSAGEVIVTPDKAYFITDSRYFDHACRQTYSGIEVVLQKDLRVQRKDILASHGIDTVMIESRSMTVAELSRLIELYPDVDFDSSDTLTELIAGARAVKTPREIEQIVKAQRIAEKAFMKLLDFLRPNITEKQVRTQLDFYMMESGADGISFDTIAASGVNSSVPHAVPTDKKLEEGDFVVLDFGAVVNGYHSDMTRTVCIGQPSEQMRRIYEAVLAANLDGMSAIRSGVTGKLADSVARTSLESVGLDKYFTHGLGHGVGLEIHEDPSLSPNSRDTLKSGMVVTVEPGVYISGGFGVRIEDMVEVTTDGRTNLTKMEKNLICL